ncbi:hypothetical protein ACT7CW_03350 [Bacillus pacificus]
MDKVAFTGSTVTGKYIIASICRNY